MSLCPNCKKNNISFLDKYKLATWNKLKCFSCGSKLKISIRYYVLLLLIASTMSYYTRTLDINVLFKILLFTTYYLLAVYFVPIKKVD